MYMGERKKYLYTLYFITLQLLFYFHVYCNTIDQITINDLHNIIRCHLTVPEHKRDKYDTLKSIRLIEKFLRENDINLKTILI